MVELGLDPAVVAKDSKGELSQHGIRTGDVVRVGEMPRGTVKKKEVSELKGKGAEGVVTRVGQRAVWVALGKDGGNVDDMEEVPDGKLWLVKLANDATYKRYVNLIILRDNTQLIDAPTECTRLWINSLKKPTRTQHCSKSSLGSHRPVQPTFLR